MAPLPQEVELVYENAMWQDGYCSTNDCAINLLFTHESLDSIVAQTSNEMAPPPDGTIYAVSTFEVDVIGNFDTTEAYVEMGVNLMNMGIQLKPGVVTSLPLCKAFSAEVLQDFILWTSYMKSNSMFTAVTFQGSNVMISQVRCK